MCTMAPGLGNGIPKAALSAGSSPSLARSSLGSLHLFPHLYVGMDGKSLSGRTGCGQLRGIGRAFGKLRLVKHSHTGGPDSDQPWLRPTSVRSSSTPSSPRQETCLSHRRQSSQHATFSAHAVTF